MIILDGRKMKERDSLHPYLQERLSLSEHYGKNLDALWDELSERNEDTTIYFTHMDECVDELGEYGLSLLALFIELTQKNEHFHLQFTEPNDDN